MLIRCTSILTTIINDYDIDLKVQTIIIAKCKEVYKDNSMHAVKEQYINITGLKIDSHDI